MSGTLRATVEKELVSVTRTKAPSPPIRSIIPATCAKMILRKAGYFLLRQKNLWATSGSGSLPSAWYSAVSVTWNVRKP